MCRSRLFGDRFKDKTSEREAHETIGDKLEMVRDVQKFPLFGGPWPQFQEILLAVVKLPDERIVYDWFHQTTPIEAVARFVQEMAWEQFQGSSVVLRHLDTDQELNPKLELKTQKNTKKEHPYNGRYGEDKVFMRAEARRSLNSETPDC